MFLKEKKKKKTSTSSKFLIPGSALINIIPNDITFPQKSLESCTTVSKNYQLLSFTLPPELDKKYPSQIYQQIQDSSAAESKAFP